MDWMHAAQTYTLLTIGDGLVSQIPSIIISTASGLIVARASSGNDLGVDVFSQLSSSSKPILLTSCVCFCCALLPGLPALPFFVLSLATAGFALLNKKNQAQKKVIEETETAKAIVDTGPKPGSTEEVTQLLGMDILELEVGFELVRIIEGGDLVERIRSIRRQFAIDYGFIVQPIHIRDNVKIKGTEYRFLLKGSIIGSGELKTRHLLAMDPGNITSPVNGIATKEPAFGLDALWINESDKEKAQFAGYTVVDLSTVIATHLTELIRSNMHELLGRQETQHLLDNLSKEYPKVVEELVPGLLNVGQVQQVLSNLLREQISIRDLRTILETIADWAVHIKHPEKLAEFVRKKLARSITSKFLTQEGTLPLASMTPTLERALGDCLQQTDEGSYLALDPRIAQVFINKLNNIGEKFAEIGQTPLLLTPSHLRAAVFRFVERFAPGYSVLSHNEIAPNTKVQSLGVVTVDELL